MNLNEKLIITKEVLEKCQDFATRSVDTSADRYARRNQSNINKIIKDIKCGKIGEEMVYQRLISHFSQLTKPDYNIYQKGDKSWEPDLKDLSSGIKVAVKSQDIESAIAYSDSWVFQNRVGSNYDVDKEIFGANNDLNYVAFVSLNTPKKIANIRAIVKVSWLHQNNLFKEMKLKNLRSNKVAVYLEDLEKFKEDELSQLYT